MNVYKISVSTIVVAVALAVIYAPAEAGMWDDPKNLKVLPEDISPERLRATMRGFAINTGSRCSTCHVAEDEQDFSTYDFSLDDKEKKHKARAMIRMVKDINSYLSETFEKPSDDLVNVDCATCHRGQNKPEMLHEVLARSYASDGLDKAIVEYRELRENYYGSYTFDFSEAALPILVEQLARKNELDAALGFADLNLEFYPESVMAFVLRAEVLAKKGDVSGARASYKKALEIDPHAGWVKRMLAALDAPKD